MNKTKKIFFITILTVATSFLVISFSGSAADEAADELKLYLGQPRTINVAHPNRIIIGNPEIADVTNITKTQMTLNPKALGKTTLVFWDTLGEQSFKVKVFAENMDDVKLRVDDLMSKLSLPNVYTRVAEEEGKVLLLGEVKTAEDRERITTALGALKGKTTDLILVKEEETVISIDVQVLELDKDVTNTLGLTNPLSTTGGITITEIGSPGISAAGTAFSNLFRVSNLGRGSTSSGTFTGNPFAWTLYALVQEGKARILSRPRLACQSGKEAELLVGGEKPIFTTTVAATTGASGTQVEYKEYGIKLKIKPTISEKERIKLGLNVEVSEVGAAETIGATNAPTAKAYPLTKRTASTELFLNNGQTMAIGGLIKKKSEEDITKTPWFGDLPVVGGLFRKKVSKEGGGSGERGNVELYITLTPTIVASGDKEKKDSASQNSKTQTPSSVLAQEIISDDLVAVPAELAHYTRAVQAKITRALTYPAQAKDAGWEGKLKLSLYLSSNGNLEDIKITKPSNYKILDDAAIEVAKNQSPYPPFPPQIDAQELWIDVPVVYKKD